MPTSNSFALTTHVFILLTALCGFGSAALAAWSSHRNGKKINRISVDINGRLSELLALTKSSAHAEGLEQGRIDGEAKVEALTRREN